MDRKSRFDSYWLCVALCCFVAVCFATFCFGVTAASAWDGSPGCSYVGWPNWDTEMYTWSFACDEGGLPAGSLAYTDSSVFSNDLEERVMLYGGWRDMASFEEQWCNIYFCSTSAVPVFTSDWHGSITISFADWGAPITGPVAAIDTHYGAGGWYEDYDGLWSTRNEGVEVPYRSVYRASGSPLPLLGVPLFSSDFGVDGFASDLAVWMLTYVLPALVVGMLVFFSVWIVPRMVRRAIGHL